MTKSSASSRYVGERDTYELRHRSGGVLCRVSCTSLQSTGSKNVQSGSPYYKVQGCQSELWGTVGTETNHCLKTFQTLGERHLVSC